MSKHVSLGRLGEELAVKYLQAAGFEVLFQNWRYGRREIDLIATRDNVLHFIEVKTRRFLDFGYPEESVDSRKKAQIAAVATEFQHQYPAWKKIQFDILSITLRDDGTEEYFFIEDIDL